jgi:hypothetical protein
MSKAEDVRQASISYFRSFFLPFVDNQSYCPEDLLKTFKAIIFPTYRRLPCCCLTNRSIGGT